MSFLGQTTDPDRPAVKRMESVPVNESFVGESGGGDLATIRKVVQGNNLLQKGDKPSYFGASPNDSPNSAIPGKKKEGFEDVAMPYGDVIGEEGKYKYVKDKSKFGEVIKRISGDTVEYRNIDKYTKEIDMDLAKKLFSYPKEINKKISLCYNLIKDSYYLKEDKTFVSVPKNNINVTNEELLALWDANKDKVKKKLTKK
jgi:hypothetical protein